ncbi:hypothetical protein ACHAXR_006344, partial [Thalassiosira sp. AJA248-18]
PSRRLNKLPNHHHPHDHHPQLATTATTTTLSASTASLITDMTVQTAMDYVAQYDYAAYDIFEDAPRNVFGMDNLWAPQNGIQRSEGFKLIQADKKGREVYATTTTDVPAGHPVLYVPESLILSSNKAMDELRSPNMEAAEQFVVRQGGESEYRQWYLMLKILKEIQNGKNSPWFQWLDSLPRYYLNAASMTDYCLQCLPPLMQKLAGEERDKSRRLTRESIEMVPFLCDDLKYHPRDFCLWAYQIVYTRSVEMEDGDLKIVPMADYFNHGSDYTEIQPSYDEAGNYYAYTTYDVPAGSPLRISYADPRNPSHLLARYGFLDEACPASYCKLLPPTVNQDMLDLGYSHDRMLFYKTGEVADEVWDIFLYTHLTSTNNMDDQQALMKAHKESDYDRKLALHEKYYSATSAALLEHVDGIIADIDAVVKKSEAHPIYVKYEHPRLPLIHRHNEFVRETFSNVRSRYSPDPAVEVNWQEATRVTVEECDDTECALAECMLDFQGNWLCEGGLAPNWDGSEREKTQKVIAAQ